MKEPKYLDNEDILELLKNNKSDVFAYDRDKVVIDGETYLAKEPYFYHGGINCTKSTANSLAKKEAEFDYNYCEEIYSTLMEHGLDCILYARPVNVRKEINHKYRYQIDLYSAYPHIFKYEALPIAGKLYKEESDTRMNFYIYHGKILRDNCMVTDELKELVENMNIGTCEFIFSTDYKIGSKIGDKLNDMVYKNKKTKADAKEIHYGYYQKKYLQYDPEDDCYIRNPKYNKEILMVAVLSHLTRIMMTIKNIIGCDDRMFMTDAYFFDTLTGFDRIKTELATKLPNYDYRFYNCIILKDKDDEDYDSHGTVIYKSYKDLPDGPKSHHKKIDRPLALYTKTDV